MAGSRWTSVAAAVAVALCVALVVVWVVRAQQPAHPQPGQPPPAESALSAEQPSEQPTEQPTEQPGSPPAAQPNGDAADLSQDDMGSLPPDPDAERIATEFARVWVSGGQATDEQAWLAQLEPVVVPDVAALLALTPLTALPDAVLTGVGEVAGQRTPTSRVFTAELSDGSGLRMRLGWNGQRWLVADYGPADEVAGGAGAGA